MGEVTLCLCRPPALTRSECIRMILGFEEHVLTLKVRVRLLGMFRGLAGKNQLQLRLESATVKEVVQAVAEALPAETRATLIDCGLNAPQLNALILLNGREISVLKGLETAVSEGDEVTLIPIVHGG